MRQKSTMVECTCPDGYSSHCPGRLKTEFCLVTLYKPYYNQSALYCKAKIIIVRSCCFRRKGNLYNSYKLYTFFLKKQIRISVYFISHMNKGKSL